MKRILSGTTSNDVEPCDICRGEGGWLICPVCCPDACEDDLTDEKSNSTIRRIPKNVISIEVARARSLMFKEIGMPTQCCENRPPGSDAWSAAIVERKSTHEWIAFMAEHCTAFKI